MAYSIDLLYWLPLSLLAIAMLSAVFKKAVNMWIGLLGIGLGAGLAWYASPYTQYAIIPIRNYVFYGTDFTLATGVAMAHILSLIFMSLVAIFNLWSTKGYTLWTMALPSGKGIPIRDRAMSLRADIRSNNDGIAGIVLIALVGIITAGSVAAYGAYRFFQAPDITYNISNPPESAYPSIFNLGGTGLNINLIIIAIALVVVVYFLYRGSQSQSE